MKYFTEPTGLHIIKYIFTYFQAPFYQLSLLSWLFSPKELGLGSGKYGSWKLSSGEDAVKHSWYRVCLRESARGANDQCGWLMARWLRQPPTVSPGNAWPAVSLWQLQLSYCLWQLAAGTTVDQLWMQRLQLSSSKRPVTWQPALRGGNCITL